jgi:hypothetical protein
VACRIAGVGAGVGAGAGAGAGTGAVDAAIVEVGSSGTDVPLSEVSTMSNKSSNVDDPLLYSAT